MTESSGRYFWKWMMIALFFHLLAAIYSVGYHSADEQFQILEFLAYKLGKAPLKDLAVEFPEHMRSWLQPGIYFVLTRIFRTLGIESPFGWAMGFRLVTGGFGWLAGVVMARVAISPELGWLRTEGARKLALRATALLCFLPVLHVRPSSESAGGSAFWLGFGMLALAASKPALNGRLGKAVLIGALFGAAFEFRFQTAFLALGCLAWFCIHDWKKARAFLPGVALGGLGVFALARWVDRWGYGQWCLSPWNYFSYNLIRGEVSRYGNAPWWDVIRMSVTEAWPPLGLVVLVALLIAWIRKPGSWFFWTTFPFFLVHEWISHKELRFFFPLITAAPLFLALAVDGLPERLKNWPAVFSGLKSLGWILALDSCAGLLVMSLTPFARTVQFYEGVYRQVEKGKPLVLYTQGRDPFEVLGTPIYFYRPDELEVRRFQAPSEFTAAPAPRWLFAPGFELPAEFSPGCKQVFRTIPSWTDEFSFKRWPRLSFGLEDWRNRVNIWSLYRCD